METKRVRNANQNDTFVQKQMHRVFTEVKFRDSDVAILELIHRMFWKSKIAVLSMFLFPLVFMIIFFIFTNVANFERAGLVGGVAGGIDIYVVFSILPICLISLPQLLVEIKQSVILRQIATSNVSSLRYNFLISLYFFMMCVLSTFFIFILILIFDRRAVDYWSNFNFGYFIYGLITFFLSALALGILFSSITKSLALVQLIGIGILLASLMLGGLLIPLRLINPLLEVKIISLFSPLDYSLGIINTVTIVADDSRTYTNILNNLNLSDEVVNRLLNEFKESLNSNIFDFTQPFRIVSRFGVNDTIPLPPTVANFTFQNIFEPWEKGLNLLFPWFFLAVTSFISVKRFQWTSR